MDANFNSSSLVVQHTKPPSPLPQPSLDTSDGLVCAEWGALGLDGGAFAPFVDGVCRAETASAAKAVHRGGPPESSVNCVRKGNLPAKRIPA